MHEIISITNGVPRMPEWQMAKPVNFVLEKNEHIAIIGKNGSGKSMFADIITGRHPLRMNNIKYNFEQKRQKTISECIKYIAFKDSYGDYDGTYYLQQRWNQHDIDENTPTVKELLEDTYNLCGEDTEERRTFQKHLYNILHIGHLLNERIILLSSGELRKFQLICSLLSKPFILIIDNPFIGLDEVTRLHFKTVLSSLANDKSVQIILILSKISDIPDFITHVVEINDMIIYPKMTLTEYTAQAKIYKHHLSKEKEYAILNLAYKNDEFNAREIIKMKNVCIKYGDKIILNNLNWTVSSGEKWALYGRNGSGKSTLLSLICADNPQSYACDISLFGIKRGSGESIWDIKKHIGYVSPEIHRAYKHNISAIEVVASGLNDSVGLYIKPTDCDLVKCKWWMNIFDIVQLSERSFLKLSSGEQRLVLLARAFVKDPELLILDEPFHGLDDANRQLVTDIIETFCKRKNKTLIMVSHYINELPKCITKKLILK